MERIHFNLLLVILLGAFACKKSEEKSNPIESQYCSAVQEHINGSTITGAAKFNVRQSTSQGLKSEVSGGPIARAEVRVFNSGGDVVQCGDTDGSGAFSLSVPSDQVLKIRVYSRGKNTWVEASVLDTPDTNALYFIEREFRSAPAGQTVDIGPMVSSAKDSAVTGGAFNILYNILRANKVLRNVNCGNENTFCGNFSVAPKSTTYWKAGVDPHSAYFGGTTPLSFYVPGKRTLYILGGFKGDVKSSDTDHFDDGVISHEYGHFLEDAFSKSDSPGGVHDGDHVIDARLAWSEGWGYFFASLAAGTTIIRDTYGNDDAGGATGVYTNYDVEKNSTSLDPSSGSMAAGEGNFREFAITRMLFDTVDPFSNLFGATQVGNNGGTNDDFYNDGTYGTDAYSGNPALLWDAFIGPFAISTVHFRGIGGVLGVSSFTTTAYNNVRDFHRVKSSTADYGNTLPTTTAGGCSGTSITIFANDVASCTIGGTVICTRGQRHQCCSNQLVSNDFYKVVHNGSFTTVSIQRMTGTADLDLFLYKDGYQFGNAKDIATSSEGTTATESISLTGVAQGTYLLNINQYTGNGNPSSASTYRVYVDGNQVCP